MGDAVLKVTIRQIREALFRRPQVPAIHRDGTRRGYRFIAETSAAYRHRPRGGTAGRFSYARLTDLPAAIVGREHALSRMLAWLSSAGRAERQVVFVTGEAGIGKTTLLESFARSIPPTGR